MIKSKWWLNVSEEYKILVHSSVDICVDLLWKKSEKQTPPYVDPPVDTATIKNPVDPELANTIGFFMDEWKPKTWLATGFVDANKPAGSADVAIKIDAAKVLTKISTSLYGHNANIYMSPMVGVREWSHKANCTY